MRLVPVASSMLVALGWEPEEGIKLAGRYSVDGKMIAQFSETSFYQYEDVPGWAAAAVIFAESVGKTFNDLIKNGGFDYKKVTAEEVFS